MCRMEYPPAKLTRNQRNHREYRRTHGTVERDTPAARARIATCIIRVSPPPPPTHPSLANKYPMHQLTNYGVVDPAPRSNRDKFTQLESRQVVQKKKSFQQFFRKKSSIFRDTKSLWGLFCLNYIPILLFSTGKVTVTGKKGYRFWFTMKN